MVSKVKVIRQIRNDGVDSLLPSIEAARCEAAFGLDRRRAADT